MSRSAILFLIGVALIALVIGLAIGSILIPNRVTTISITTVSVSTSSSRLYELMFNQTGVCSPQVFLAPWSVTLANKTTVVEPSNATFPLSENSAEESPANEIYSTIVFSVPNGTYNYTVHPQNFLAQHSGNVTVSGSDVTVEVGPAFVSCTTSSG